MRAAIYYGPLNVKILEVDDPSINDGGLLIKPVVVGVCPTDVRIYYMGSSSIKPPVILGHEVSGVIVESMVSEFLPGDRVNVAADAPCLNCRYCRKGLHNLCEDMLSIGFNVDGAYATLMKVPSRFIRDGLVFRLPEHASFEEGALIEPVAVSLNALNLVYPSNEDNVVVVGDGPNALIHVMLLRNYFKVRKVFVVGLTDRRLKAALSFGADKVINTLTLNSPSDLISEIGEPIDIIDVTVGNQDAVREIMPLISKGVRITFFGGSHPDTDIPISINKIHYNQLLMTGSSGTTIGNYRKAVELVTSRIIDLRKLITHKFPLNEITEAFEASRKGLGLKVVVVP
jgi:L-iditol 2-dehydrogenase